MLAWALCGFIYNVLNWSLCGIIYNVLTWALCGVIYIVLSWGLCIIIYNVLTWPLFARDVSVCEALRIIDSDNNYTQRNEALGRDVDREYNKDSKSCDEVYKKGHANRRLRESSIGRKRLMRPSRYDATLARRYVEISRKWVK